MVYCRMHFPSDTKMISSISTEILVKPGLSLADDAIVKREEENRIFRPVERHAGSTRAIDLEQPSGTTQSKAEGLQRKYYPPQVRMDSSVGINANSVPLEIWEGTVLEIDADAGTMQVLLDAKMGQMPRHTGEIELEWVDEQDRDLVVPGAVFYLTLFKRSKPSVENAQELRFRRRPSWTASQLRQIEADATEFLSKMRPLPSAK